LLIKYIKSVLWRVVKRLSYTEEARCLKVKTECVKDWEMLRVNETDKFGRCIESKHKYFLASQ